MKMVRVLNLGRYQHSENDGVCALSLNVLKGNPLGNSIKVELDSCKLKLCLMKNHPAPVILCNLTVSRIGNCVVAGEGMQKQINEVKHRKYGRKLTKVEVERLYGRQRKKLKSGSI